VIVLRSLLRKDVLIQQEEDTSWRVGKTHMPKARHNRASVRNPCQSCSDGILENLKHASASRSQALLKWESKKYNQKEIRSRPKVAATKVRPLQAGSSSSEDFDDAIAASTYHPSAILTPDYGAHAFAAH